jgi:tRNA(Arg) A34 adenosine deaminase TadA
MLLRAVALALENVALGGGPFGAVITRGGEVIAEGVNRVVAEQDPTAHAEVVAIRRAGQKIGDHSLAGCEMYASCEPCPMCLGALLWARIDRVWYAAGRADAAAAGFDDAAFYQQFQWKTVENGFVIQRVAVEGFANPFDAWRRNSDKVPY